MNIKDLREKTKAAYKALTAYRRTSMGSQDEWNMRQAWVHCYGYYDRFTNDKMTGPMFKDEYHRLVMALAKAGDDYYFAKKHGIDAAVLRKLSR